MSTQKSISVELVPTNDAAYGVLHKMRRFHPHLATANIALAWNYGWSEDADGNIKLGTCQKSTDLQRDIHQYDFIITLNHDFWHHKDTTDLHRNALLDHELCHARVAEDADGETVEDEKGRTCYRIAKHDVEEFHGVVQRHGLWRHDIEAFAKHIAMKLKQPLLVDSKEDAANDTDTDAAEISA